ncbi:hypothetical protein O181_033629 [Austropuccinia psidii MF-1]|uniref:Uncharacterized protein n=1 Tax=Austropuccinia psidii MF-1 TaxID=1389203 RepID=A0A9Q3H8R2_9BASI|nr:hypothetical protein [Austropuccinia psidii MF-1]
MESQKSQIYLLPTPRAEAKEKEKVIKFFYNLIKESKQENHQETIFKRNKYTVEKMEQTFSSNLPPLPEDTVEEQYAEESEEEDQTKTIQSLMKQMEDLLLTQGKKK